MANILFWFNAARPKTLTASLSPILVGIGFAIKDASFNMVIALATLCTSLLIQIGTNFANDYYDALKGSDTAQRKGPKRLSQNKWIKLTTIKSIYTACFLTAFICSCYLTFHGGPVIFLTAIISIVFGILYTATKYALAYNGLGDLFVLIFFGPVATSCTYFLQTNRWSIPVTILGIGVGLYSVGILIVNNIRDMDEDKKTNKKTLAVRLGQNFSIIEYIICIILPLSFPIIVAKNYSNYMGVCLSLFTIFFIPSLIKNIINKSGYELNPVLANTGKVGFIYTVLITVGLIII